MILFQTQTLSIKRHFSFMNILRVTFYEALVFDFLSYT
jgi:hypothetical protein